MKEDEKNTPIRYVFVGLFPDKRDSFCTPGILRFWVLSTSDCEPTPGNRGSTARLLPISHLSPTSLRLLPSWLLRLSCVDAGLLGYYMDWSRLGESLDSRTLGIPSLKGEVVHIEFLRIMGASEMALPFLCIASRNR